MELDTELDGVPTSNSPTQSLSTGNSDGVLYEGKTAQQWAQIAQSWKGRAEKGATELTTLKKQVADLFVENDTLKIQAETTSTRATQLESELTQTKKTLESQLAKLTLQQQVRGVIAEKYPELLAFEAQGLIQPGDKQGEELDAYLSTFAKNVNALKQGAVEQFRAGTPPPPPNPMQTLGQPNAKRGAGEITEELRKTPANDPRHAELVRERLEAITEGRA